LVNLLDPGLNFYAVTFTDIVRSTDHRAQLGDRRADAYHADVDVMTRRAMELFRGVVIKSLGDGLMAIFRAPTDALLAALEVQRQLARRNRTAPVAVNLRVGITVGEVDVVDGDVYGYPVNEAARLCAAADPSGILVSELAASLARRADVEFGEAREVLVTPSAPATRALTVVVPVEDMALVPLNNALTLSWRKGHFVGRARDLDEHLSRWTKAMGGESQISTITGDAGLGKTTLLGELAREVSRGPGIVLYGHCDERVASPYEPFVEAFNHFAEHCPEEDLKKLVGPTAGELARLVPALARRLVVTNVTPRLDPEYERWHLHEAFVETLRSLSNFEPVLLIVDDLHWAGSSTIELIERILRDCRRERFMMVLALRPWDPTTQHEVTQFLADRHRLEADVLDVELKGLDRDDVGELVAIWMGDAVLDESKIDELWSITDGNPLFVTQVLNDTDDEGVIPTQTPSGVADVIDRQLNRLTPATKNCLRVASLVGLRFEAHVVVLATQASRSVVLDCLDEATLAGVVRPLDGAPLRYEFTHAVVRTTLENQFSAARLRDTHASIALAIEQTPGLESAERARRLAFHWNEAGEFGDPEKGVGAACEAIGYALGSLALSDAFELLERAEKLARYAPAKPHAELAVLLAEARCLAAQPEARDDQLAAVRAALAVGDARLLSRAALAHSRGYFTAWGHRDDERTSALESALALCATEDRSTRARLMSRLANELTFDDQDRRQFTLVDEALELARQLDDSDVLASVLNHRQYIFAAPEYLGLRRREVQELQDLAVARSDRLLEMHACRLMSAVATESADVEQLDAALLRLEQLNKEVDLAGSKWELASVRASRALLAGELKDAAAQVREAFALGAAAGQSDAFIFTGAQLMHLNYLRGRLPEIIDVFIEAVPPEVKEHMGAWITRQLYLAGRFDQATEWWQETLRIGIDAQMTIGVNAGLVLTSWSYLASVFDADETIVAELQRRLDPVADQLFQQLAPDQPGHHFLALLADSTGKYESCDQHFASALSLLKRAHAPVMSAISEVAWANSLVRRGEIDRARALARAAHGRSSHAGATQIERDALEILERVG
jgi:predicted ATPase